MYSQNSNLRIKITVSSLLLVTPGSTDTNLTTMWQWAEQCSQDTSLATQDFRHSLKFILKFQRSKVGTQKQSKIAPHVLPMTCEQIQIYRGLTGRNKRCCENRHSNSPNSLIGKTAKSHQHRWHPARPKEMLCRGLGTLSNSVMPDIVGPKATNIRA